jgi:hypothetical protein
MEDGDLPRAVCHEKKIVGLIESRHFQLGVRLKSIVLVKPAMFWLPDLFTVVSKLKRALQEVWRVMVPFYFYEIAMAADGFGFNDNKRIGRIMTKGSLRGILTMRCKLPLCAGIHWRCASIH